MDELVQSVTTLIGLRSIGRALPSLTTSRVVDSASAYEAVSEWLHSDQLHEVAADVEDDMQAHRAMGHRKHRFPCQCIYAEGVVVAFPCLAFAEHLQRIAFWRMRTTLGYSEKDQFYVFKVALRNVPPVFEDKVREAGVKLQRRLDLRKHRSPKRRPYSGMDDSAARSASDKCNSTSCLLKL